MAYWLNCRKDMSSLYFSRVSLCISLKMNENALICAYWELGLCPQVLMSLTL